ncbi:hypothetical protein [Ignatzschineria indica]|uniref:Uncharacterized protein n=1 Tax=Ignatzschineria indica TaxID=472583 RepID=A0A2U2AID9_9GAMM|nr:hypothetical protein [Ignatzschineria indica]PWD82435.1 hypothetical protein DC082_09160 [Ignatzschineria indica]
MFDTKAVELPETTTACFYESHAGKLRSQLFDYQKTFSASEMPTCGHAFVIRARSFSPAALQTLLLLEAIKHQRLKAAGSHYLAFPETTRRKVVISIAGDYL